jgi:hypothetical protein
VSPPERKFAKSTKLNTILIDKKDLLKLDELIKTAFSAEDIISIEISTDYDNTNIKAKSYDDFMAINRMPDKLNKLGIIFSSNDKLIYIMLENYRMYLSVSGTDETWVLGTFHKLSSFFANKKPWFYSRKIVIILYAIVIGLIGGIATNLYSKNNILLAILFTIIVLCFYYIAATRHFEKYFPFFELRLSPKINFLDKEMIIIILTALTLIVAIIGGIIIPLIK